MPSSQREHRAEEASANSDGEASSDHESDSEDGQDTDIGYTISKSQAHDHALLVEEEERENLLAAEVSRNGSKRVFDRGHSDGNKIVIGKGERVKKDGQRRRTKKRKRSRTKDKEGETMYEMEEGGGREDTSSLSSSSSAELDRLRFDHNSTSKVDC